MCVCVCVCCVCVCVSVSVCVHTHGLHAFTNQSAQCASQANTNSSNSYPISFELLTKSTKLMLQVLC